MKLKLFLASFLISFPLWWGVNVLGLQLEDFFFSLEILDNSQLLAAQANQELLLLKFKNLKQRQREKLPELEISAKAAMVVQFTSAKWNGREQKVLFQKNISERLPIASLSKLMTALVALENYSLSQEIEISREAVAQEESIGNFKAGEKFRVQDIISSALTESSNDAAFALSEALGKEKFVVLMNSRARDIGLQNTYFANPTGLDPDNEQEEGNYSTAEDLAKLTIYLLKNQPFIWEALSRPTMKIELANGQFHHLAKSTNALLGKIPHILGGKTGYTDEALGCFVLVLKNPESGDYLVNIIFGSDNRFAEMESLLEWIEKTKN